MTSVFARTGDKACAGDDGPAVKASFALPHDTLIGNGILNFVKQ
jgi:hypothetical protein